MTKAKPTLVLAIIATVISAMVITASQVWPEETGLTDSLKAKCVELWGGNEEDYFLAEWTDFNNIIEQPRGVRNIITNKNGNKIINVVANGYAKDGLNVLVAIDDDGVKGIVVVELKETPGFGERAASDEFLDSFIGLHSIVTPVKSAPKNDNEVQTVTGATRSSRGMIAAVNLAVRTYKSMEIPRLTNAIRAKCAELHGEAQYNYAKWTDYSEHEQPQDVRVIIANDKGELIIWTDLGAQDEEVIGVEVLVAINQDGNVVGALMANDDEELDSDREEKAVEIAVNAFDLMGGRDI
ncbi:MAG: FMN-binding protein [Oscillospiraceae bacterium]|nr:FMN-binding protein [Oscillospiraceae bacterium]